MPSDYPTIAGDATNRPATTMKQYGNIDPEIEGAMYEYEIPIDWVRSEAAGETCYIHATQVPEDFMTFHKFSKKKECGGGYLSHISKSNATFC